MKQLYFPQGTTDEATYQELLRIAAAIDEAGNITFELLSAPPQFPLAFHAVAADGVNWDPLEKGSGEPYLVWYNPAQKAWQEIGSGANIDLGNYYTKDEINDFLDGKVNNEDFADAINNVDQAIGELTEGLQDSVDEITAIKADISSVEGIVANNSSDIADLVSIYGDTASAAASAAAAAASQSAAAAAEAAAILAKGGAETARDEAVLAKIAAEDAETDAGNYASSAFSSASDASAYANDAELAAAAAENARVEAIAAANTAVNAAQGGVTIDAAAGALWTFDEDLESWTGSDPSPTWDSDGYLTQGTGSDPKLTSPPISVNGAGYKEVVARIRRTAGSGWEGRIRYSTSGHSFSGTYEVVLADPFLVNGEWQIVTWDFSEIDDWASSTITGLEVQLGSDAGDGEYEIDWIGIGNNIASLAQAAATSASNAAASASAAANSAAAANSSAISASSSAAGAAGSAAAAAISASSASTSASEAEISASAAEAERIAAEAARSGAEVAETNAVTAKNDAEGAAAAAASSEINAANSAISATNSASAASSSASQASSSAINAATSASAALASEVAANASAGNAANAASAAAISASNASVSASDASAAASAASGSATQAAISANAASTSASQASNSSIAAANAAQNAGTSAASAANSAATATMQASNASASAASAAESATLAAQAVGTIAAVNPMNVTGNNSRWSIYSGPGTFQVASVNHGGRLGAVGQLVSNGDTQLLSDTFKIDPTGIYEVRFSVAKNVDIGLMYVGVYGDSPGVSQFQGVENQAAVGSFTSNPYWVHLPAASDATQWQDCIVYLLGSAADVSKCPDGVISPGMSVLTGRGLRATDASNLVRLRFLNWGNNGQQSTMYISNVYVSRYDNKASAEIKNEATARANADSALASQITSLSSTVGGHTASITSLQEVADGLSAKWTLTLNNNGHISGMQIANGGQGQSSMVFLTDRFAVAQPNGSNVTFPFTIGSVNGVSTIGINGNLVVDGTIVARSIANNAMTPQKLTNAVLDCGYAKGNFFVASGNGAFQKAAEITINYPHNVGGGQLWLEVDWWCEVVHLTNINPAGTKISLRRVGVEVDSYTLDVEEQSNWLGRIITGAAFLYAVPVGSGANGIVTTFQVGITPPNGTGNYSVQRNGIRYRLMKLT